MKTNAIPAFECHVGDADRETGIFAISMVECPAVRVGFVALEEAARPVRLSLNKQKQVLTGPALIPDRMIYRNDPPTGEHYIKFSRASIEHIAQKMMRQGVALQSTTHQHERGLAGNFLTELWIVENPKCDKAVALGLGELPAGSLVASYKISDKSYWQKEVLTGNVKGFSIEGIFKHNPIIMTQAKKNAAPAAAVPSKFKTALAKVLGVSLEGDTAAEAKDLATEAGKDETGSAEALMIFTLADGTECRVDAEGFATLDGEQMPAGEHALDDGNVIVVDDAGQLVITQPEGDGADPAQAAAELAAKSRAKAFLAKKATPANPKISELEKQLKTISTELAALKKEPSAQPAKAKEGDDASRKAQTTEERIARAVSMRIARAHQK